jgi:ribosomal protein S30
LEIQSFRAEPGPGPFKVGKLEKTNFSNKLGKSSDVSKASREKVDFFGEGEQGKTVQIQKQVSSQKNIQKAVQRLGVEARQSAKQIQKNIFSGGAVKSSSLEKVSSKVVSLQNTIQKNLSKNLEKISTFPQTKNVQKFSDVSQAKTATVFAVPTVQQISNLTQTKTATVFKKPTVQQKVKQTTRSQSLPTIPSFSSPEPGPSKIIIPIIPDFSNFQQDKQKKKVNKKSLVKGFDVLVKRGGRFSKISSKPLPKKSAFKFGAERVAKTAARTFKLKEAGKVKKQKVSISSALKKMFRKPRKRNLAEFSRRIDCKLLFFNKSFAISLSEHFFQCGRN